MTSTRAALPRRRFLGLSAAGTLAAIGDLGLLANLPPVPSAASVPAAERPRNRRRGRTARLDVIASS